MSEHCILELRKAQGRMERISIPLDRQGYASLTELWKRAGSPDTKRPSDWVVTQEAKEFMAYLSNAGQAGIWKTRRGKVNGGTYSILQVALAYAQYLSPEFKAEVLQVYIERKEEEANPELAYTRGRDRAIAGYQRQGKDDTWIFSRFKGIDTRKEFTQTLASKGVDSYGYGRCTNAIYKPLLGGTARELKVRNGLAEKDNLRDNLAREHITSVDFAEMLAAKRMDADCFRGTTIAEKHCHTAAQITRDAIQRAIGQ